MSRAKCCWPRCAQPVVPSGVPVCRSHYEQIGRHYQQEQSRLFMAEMQRHERKAKPRRHAARVAEEIARNEREARRRASREAASVVYYVRIGDRIKIGYTTDLTQRMRSLRAEPHNLLATEPGGRTLEAERHEQFAAYRIGRREDFIDSTAIREHVQELRERAVERAS